MKFEDLKVGSHFAIRPDGGEAVYELLRKRVMFDDELARDLDRSEPWWELYIRFVVGVPGCHNASPGDEDYVMAQPSSVEVVQQ